MGAAGGRDPMEHLVTVISWRVILPTATVDDSRRKVWKKLTAQATAQPLLSLQLPIGRQKKSAKSSKRKIPKQ
jgi:hypothetical protein